MDGTGDRSRAGRSRHELTECDKSDLGLRKTDTLGLRRADSDLSKVEVKKELALSSKPWTKCLLGDMKELNIKSIKALEDISKKRDVFRIRSCSAYTQN